MEPLNKPKTSNGEGFSKRRQGQRVGTDMVTPTEMCMRRPRITRGHVQHALSTNFFHLGLPG